MISWITTVILSTPRASTSARAPWFSAIIRFWIRVESLNRPPTLLTISSSFSSSIMVSPQSAAVLLEDPGEPLNRAVELVVDHLDIVTCRHLDLAPRVGQSALDGGLVVGPACSQPIFQRLEAGRLDEDQERLRHFLPNLKASLYIDHQDHTETVCHRQAHRLGGRPVEMTVDQGRLEQIALNPLELLGAEKDVIAVALLAAPRVPCRCRDRRSQAELRPREQAPYQRALA